MSKEIRKHVEEVAEAIDSDVFCDVCGVDVVDSGQYTISHDTNRADSGAIEYQGSHIFCGEHTPQIK